MIVDTKTGPANGDPSGAAEQPETPLRVAYVTMQFPRPSETFAGTDVRTLREHGVEVEVYSLRPEHREHDALLRQRGLVGVPTFSLTAARFGAGLAMLVTRPSWWLALLVWIVRWQAKRPAMLARCLVLAPTAVAHFRQIDAGAFDVVHLFWGHYPSMVAHLVQRFAPRVVVSVFLGAYDIQEDRYGSFVPGSVPVAKRADLVWTHSRSNLERFRALGIPEERVRCVYRGVDLRQFPFVPLTNVGAREGGLVVSIGSLIERKAMDDVLHVIARVRPRVPGVHLRVLGKGPELDALRAQARSLGVGDIVTFDGHVSTEAIAAALQRASAFILMSRSDRIPNVVKEAMASGCPCVVSGTQGMEELIIHRQTGYLVRVGDVDDATDHLANMLVAPREHIAMTEAARNHVERAFSAEASMLEYRRGWRAALDARAATSGCITNETRPPTR